MASAAAAPEHGIGGEDLVSAVVDWFDQNARALPWRQSTPWGVLVSEFMLQQTPVDRVLPVWGQWMNRWPTPPSLAGSSVGEAVRAWGRLGYPRRARRLHEAATVISDRHDGEVPLEEADLLALPGVGSYTAAAVQAFAFERHSIVLDTNVRRVLARTLAGQDRPRDHITAAERSAAESIWPTDHVQSARWSAAVMELGALVCTSRAPACSACPVLTTCAWHQAGSPAASTTPRRQAVYEGSDRQVRGRILALLRDEPAPVTRRRIRAVWTDEDQRERALAGLVADGLVVRVAGGRYGLPD